MLHTEESGSHRCYICILFSAGDFDQLDVDKFVEESLKMGRFKHAHVMGLIGVCLDAGSAPYIVMPYMANGSLLQYLRKERKNIVFSDNADEDEVYTYIYVLISITHLNLWCSLIEGVQM